MAHTLELIFNVRQSTSARKHAVGGSPGLASGFDGLASGYEGLANG